MRQELVRAVRRVAQAGLNHGATGNLSLRTGTGMLITPTAVPWDQLGEADLVDLSLEGEAAPGQGRPSSEWRLHAGIYRARPDAAAVVHAHPPFATTFACLREPIPAVHYMIAVTGGPEVRCSEYATFGTDALSVAALAALGTSRACLLANHGLVTVGGTLEEAVMVAEEVEVVAEYCWRGRAIGTPVVLGEAEMAEALAGCWRYGRYRR